MGLTDLKDAIEKSAASDATAILEEGKQEASQILQLAKKRVLEDSQNREQAQKDRAEKIKSRLITQAKFEAKKKILESKREILQNVLVLAKSELKNLPASKKQQLITMLLNKARSHMETARVYVNESDLKLVQGHSALAAPIIGGVIAENKDGTVRIDYSFDSILEQVFQQSMPEVAEILFA